MMPSRSLAAGDAFPFAAHRSPRAAGKYQAMVNLASSSRGAVTFAGVQSH